MEDTREADPELRLWLRALEEAYRAHPIVEQRALENFRRWDSVVAWMVGLCAGTIVAVGPALSTFVDLKAVPSGWLLAMYGCLLVAVIVGVLQREAIGRAQEHHSSYSSRRHGVLSGTMAAAFALQRSAAIANVRDAITDKGPEVAAAIAAGKRAERCANILGHGFRWTFFLALGLLAGLAVRGASVGDGTPSASTRLPRDTARLTASKTPPTANQAIAADIDSDTPQNTRLTGLAGFLETGQPYWWSLLADAGVAFVAVWIAALVAFAQDRKTRREQEESDRARREQEEKTTAARIVYSALEETRMAKGKLVHLMQGLRPEQISVDPLRGNALDFALKSPLTFAWAPYSLIVVMRSTANTLELVRVRLEMGRLAAVIGQQQTPSSIEALRVNALTGVELIEEVFEPEAMRWLEAMPGGVPHDERVDAVVDAVKRVRARRRAPEAPPPVPETPGA